MARAGLELVTFRSQNRRFPSTPHMSTKLTGSCLLNLTSFYTDPFFVLEWLEYMDIANAYGGVDFLITSDTYYPASWQRVNGDPHGQVAEEEKPDPLGDETLSFDFPDTGTHTLLLWSHSNLG